MEDVGDTSTVECWYFLVLIAIEYSKKIIRNRKNAIARTCEKLLKTCVHDVKI